MSTKLGQTPAFPEMHDNTDVNKYVNAGMSKRFYAACAAMQGLLANSDRDIVALNPEQLLFVAYEHADELLKQENGE